MVINWEYVKERTLWSYEDLLKKLQQLAYYERLKACKIVTNLDLLEHGRTTTQRTKLADESGIPVDFLLSLVHKSDLSRLAYVRGKTVGHLCSSGYDTLDKVANADLPENGPRIINATAQSNY